MSLFNSHVKGEAVLLIDASGSTASQFDGKTTVFDRIYEVASSLGHERYRVLFWNSPQSNTPENKYPDGVLTLPFVVKQENLKMTFQMARTSNGFGQGTCPHLAFQKMPREWIKDPNTAIYYITDGQIGGGGIDITTLNRFLVDSIRALGDIRLFILTVETVQRDYNQVESLQNAAGCDVYKLLVQNNMTGMITKFISYFPDGFGGMKNFTQINKTRAPAGYIPYGENYFSETRVNEFIKYIGQELANSPDESSQLQIAQNLSATLYALTRDKPRHLVNDIIRQFSYMFKIDDNLIRYILTDAIEKERNGSAALYSSYRANLKNLYKMAGDMLKKDVREAINSGDNFVGFPVNGNILTGPTRAINSSLTIKGQIYPAGAINSCTSDGTDIQLPIFSTDGFTTDLGEQCLRQWTRAVYSSIYKVDVMSDLIIYLVLGTTVNVVNSNIPDGIKDAYRRLSVAMLRKKRLNVDQTELDRLEGGNLPIPNSGKLEDFLGYMRETSKLLGIEARPMRLWLEMCRALPATKLLLKQEHHCKTHVEFSDDFKFSEYRSTIMPHETMYDYNCLITLDDVSSIGGWRFLPHKTASGHTCNPVYVLSERGHLELLTSNNCVCPICYSVLEEKNFEKVDKKANFVLPDEFRHQLFRNESSKIVINESSKVVNGNAKAGKLIILRGTVGAGKSFYSEKTRKEVLERGGECLIASPDRYCITGLNMKSAVAKVMTDIANFVNLDHSDKVLILDVCNENISNNQNNFFGANFTGWTKEIIYPNLKTKGKSFENLNGYLRWSLYNVLTRKAPAAGDTHYLTPVGAGDFVCRDVHRKKAVSLFGKNNYTLTGYESLDELKVSHDEYQQFVESN